jgi:hypothetical protein
MTIIATIWLILKWLFIISAATAAVVALIGLFHPLRFNLDLRGSIKGQRAEFWFVYLFRSFQIGVIATPHTQDVILKILFWEKILQRNQRSRPEPAKPEGKEDFAATHEPLTPQQPESFKEREDGELKTETEAVPPERKEAAASPEETTKVEKKPETPTGTEKEDVSETVKSETVEPETVEPDKSVAEPIEPELEQRTRSSVEKPEVISEEPPESIEPTEPIKPIEKIDPFSEEFKEKSTEEASKKEETLNQKLRNLRKKFSQLYLRGRKYLKIAIRKYRLLSPIFFKFWKRSKKGFRIEHPTLKCRYALHEPYLTGMCQGNLAVFSGMLQRFGIDFIPVPVFTAPTLYTRAKASAVILPWRFVFAVTALLFEKVLWLEAWKLFKWYRASKSV